MCVRFSTFGMHQDGWLVSQDAKDIIYLRFHPTTRFNIFKALLDDVAEILKAAEHGAGMNDIEAVVRVQPVIFGGIVQEKVNVIRYPEEMVSDQLPPREQPYPGNTPVWLDRTEIRANDLFACLSHD